MELNTSRSIYETPGAKPHEWEQLYAALDNLDIDEVLDVHLSDERFIRKARNAVYRHYRLAGDVDWTYSTSARGSTLIVYKVRS